MCDTVVVVPETGPVWFAKNSNREPSEAQFLECHEGSSLAAGAPEGLLDVPLEGRVLLSRPAWMWGCEMGVNADGLAIGNEAVWARLPALKAGFSGMDFQRVVLATCRTADDALEHLIELTERFPQGGPMQHRHRSHPYHSSFVLADATKAWVFETAGRFWAAKRVRGVATISNALTIQNDFDRVHKKAYDFARDRGWVDTSADFAFARAFSHRAISVLSGAEIRRACTERSLSGVQTYGPRDFIRALTDHDENEPIKGLRGVSPCSHASWIPTRVTQQTTASLIVRLDEAGSTLWATGTSSPCLSVFKPAPFDPALFPLRPVADPRFDANELWWAHERLHRACLADYHARRVAFAEDHERFQDTCLEPTADAATVWREHRARIDDWLPQALEIQARRLPMITRWYWARQSKLTSMPA